MKSVSIIKLHKGYREWCKTKTAADALKKKWEAE